jgi:iron complex outermembrane receptor protein
MKRALLLILSSLLAQSAFGQMTGAIQGRVADATSAPIMDSAVTLQALPAGARATARTETSGRFRFEALAAGRYQLTAKTSGFTEFRQTIELAAGQTREMEVTLQPASVTTEIIVHERIAEVSGSVTKSDIPLLETPQSISVVSREMMTAQAPLSFQEALRYTPGVRSEQYGFDARGDWASIRGGGFGQFMNGMRMLFGSYNNVRPDPFALEQIEVMRGPSSVLFGQGGFGGVINLVSKRPLPVQRGEIAVQIGSFGRKQLAVDLTGPIDAESKWLYRFVGIGRDSNTQVHYVPDDRIVAAPALTFRPRNGTRLTLLTNFQEDRTGSSVGFFPWRGTLLPNPNGQIHTSTFISEPGFDEYNTSQRAVGYLFEHHFNSRWTVRQNFNYSHSKVSYQTIYSAFAPRPGFNPDDRTLNRVLWMSKPTANSPTFDTNAETRFRTGFIRHTALAGFDFQQASITGFQGSGSVPAIDVYAPVYGNYTVPRLTPIAKNRQHQKGIYAQDQLKIGEHWSALLGIRKDWAFAETVGNPASRLDTGAVTGRAGLVYLTSFGLAPYVSYTESFLPVSGIDFYNNPYRPQRGKQWEAGAKFEPGNGRMMVSAALFNLRETNRRTPDPANPLNSIQVGEVQSRGAEFDARTRLAWGVDVLANYTYNLARVSKSNSADLGKRLATMPLHLSSVWATKRFRLNNGRSIVAGPGVRYTGSAFDGIDVLRTPSYTIFDASVAYETPGWRIAVNGANLGDKVILAACLARGDCFYGARRTVTATLSYRF